jgi:hypothetical protein
VHNSCCCVIGPIRLAWVVSCGLSNSRLSLMHLTPLGHQANGAAPDSVSLLLAEDALCLEDLSPTRSSNEN